MTPTRYRIQQNSGEYCLKGCDDGDLMDYTEHAAIVERITHERDEAERLADLRLGYKVQRDRKVKETVQHGH